MEILHEHLMVLNPLAIGAATLAMVIVGWIWYTQPLFGRAFIRLSGVRPGDIRPEHMRRTAIANFITCAFSSVLLNLIYIHIGQSKSILYYCIGFIWLFIMLSQFNGFLWRREPFALFLLQTLRSLITLMAGGAVLTFWSFS